VGNAASASFTYSIVSNGKIHREAFQTSIARCHRQSEVRKDALWTVVEAIAPGVTQPVSASGGGKDCDAASEWILSRVREASTGGGHSISPRGRNTQQKFEPMRFISRAGEQMQEKKLFHPIADPKAYMDAIVQYALWSKLEGWNQEQFTQHFVERTKENADALRVKWTKEMENALRAAAPGRWTDISEMHREAAELEKNSGQGRGGRRGGGGRGGRRGAARAISNPGKLNRPGFYKSSLED